MATVAMAEVTATAMEKAMARATEEAMAMVMADATAKVMADAMPIYNSYIKLCFEQMRKEINSATNVAL